MQAHRGPAVGEEGDRLGQVQALRDAVRSVVLATARLAYPPLPPVVVTVGMPSQAGSTLSPMRSMVPPTPLPRTCGNLVGGATALPARIKVSTNVMAMACTAHELARCQGRAASPGQHVGEAGTHGDHSISSIAPYRQAPDRNIITVATENDRYRSSPAGSSW